VLRVALGECRAVAWPVPVLRTKTERSSPIGTWSRAPPPSESTAWRTFRASPFRATRAWTRLPGDFTIRITITAHAAAFRAVFIAVTPYGVARGALFGCVPPGSVISFSAVAGTATPHRPFVVPTVLIPTDVAIFAALVVVSSVSLTAPALANGSVGIFADSAPTSSCTPVVCAGKLAVAIIVRRVGHFVRSNFACQIGPPISLSRELHQCGCRDPSEKHQRVVAHQHFLNTSNAVPFSESTRSPTLEISSALAP
jgi:hypothetical protein